MITPAQIKLVQIARRSVDLDEPRYRLLLRNVGGVDSTTKLGNGSFEEVMAVLEDMGFEDRVHGAGYWGKAATRRMAWKVRKLAESSRYALPALCGRFSRGRTDDVDQLYPRELWSLIEMLKDSNEREAPVPRRAADPADMATARALAHTPAEPAVPAASGGVPLSDDEIPF